jgi:hypothetical protein
MPTTAKKLKEYEVQFSVKWVNFQLTVEAESSDAALELAYKKPMKAFTIRAGNEDVMGLAGIFRKAQDWPRAERADGCCDSSDDEDEAEED